MSNKMKKLNEMLSDSSSLAEGLIFNATKHKNYKVYTSIEKALLFFLTGEIYFSDGSNWNDTADRNQMHSTNSFAMCTSYSTKENVAMWMLYGDKLGKNGAVLNLTGKIIKEIIDIESIEIVEVKKGCRDNHITYFNRDNHDFDIYATDIIYTNKIEKEENKVIISCNNSHETVDASVLDDSRIFSKKYEWKYENECRLVINLSPECLQKLEESKRSIKDKDTYIAIKAKVKSFKKITEDRFIRSPIYNGNISFGFNSELFGEIDWKLHE